MQFVVARAQCVAFDSCSHTFGWPKKLAMSRRRVSTGDLPTTPWSTRSLDEAEKRAAAGAMFDRRPASLTLPKHRY